MVGRGRRGSSGFEAPVAAHGGAAHAAGYGGGRAEAQGRGGGGGGKCGCGDEGGEEEGASAGRDDDQASRVGAAERWDRGVDAIVEVESRASDAGGHGRCLRLRRALEERHRAQSLWLWLVGESRFSYIYFAFVFF